ncbi:methyltransferase domain-containing protein [Singulisphaera sp. PoT]|uniref:class I SAM-dependent methyltransferase n=1 Tax=Singulisphaera sp. PoT TaxID=3411797 RepID=UPI003BF4BA33
MAESILSWPLGIVAGIASDLLSLRQGRDFRHARLVELEELGLVTMEGRLTGVGRILAYHQAEYERQAAGDFIEGSMLDRMELGPDSRVLDVGAGAGQSLRLLGPLGVEGRTGVDIDLVALAFGCRMSEACGERIQFVRGSAESLPFPDASFTHVISRVALNYVHQATALSEMARVLRPGGLIYCRAEGPGHDLKRLFHSRNPYRILGELHHFAHGVVFGMTGRQMTPGQRFAGGRTFATLKWIARRLKQGGCEVLAAETPRYASIPRQYIVLARKEREAHGRLVVGQDA